MNDTNVQSADTQPRGLDRRRFLRLAGLGVVSTSLLAACAPAAPAAPTAAPAAKPTTAPTTAPAAKPTSAPAAAKPTEAPKPAAAARTDPAAAAKPTTATAAAAGGDWKARWDQVLADARKEGKVVVYGPPGDIIRRNFSEGFPKAYPGIALEWNAGSTGQNASKVEAERRAGVFAADVFLGGSGTANSQLKPIGAADPIMPALILPEVSDPTQWRDNRFDFTDREKSTNLAFVNLPLGMVAYNTDLVRPEDLEQPQNLLDPKWKGKILITDPLVGSGSPGITQQFLWTIMGADGSRFIRALRAQAPEQGGVDRDARRILETLARGRVSIVIGPSDGAISQLEQQGIKNLGVIRAFKDHGGVTTASFGTLTRLNRPANPNAQLVFINWLLNKDGQTAYSTALGQPSLRKDVSLDHVPASSRLQSNVKYWPSHYEEFAEVPEALKTLLQDLYGRVQS